MINPSFQELEKISKSRYEIAMMAAKRAKQIISGDKPLVKGQGSKPVTIALSEIMSDKVSKLDPNKLSEEVEIKDTEGEEK